VFVSGYAVAFVFARIMIEKGTTIASTCILKRAWQIYVAHLLLFCDLRGDRLSQSAI
jgi:hypothetical protein